MGEGYDAMARRLLGLKADVNRRTDYGFTPLMAAVQSRNEVLTATLLEHRAEVNARTEFDGRSALHLSVAGGNVDLCRALVDSRADPHLKDRKGKTPLEKAQENDHTELV